MSDFTDVTFGIKAEKIFRGRNLAGGRVRIVSYEGQSVGEPDAFDIEHELQQVQANMARRHAECVFTFMGIDMAEDIVDGAPSPAVFLAKLDDWTSRQTTLKHLQRGILAFNADETSMPLDESHEEFDPQIGGLYGILNQKRELITAGIGLSFNGTLLALEGVRRSLVVASPEALVYQTNSYYGGRHSLHRVIKKPFGVR